MFGMLITTWFITRMVLFPMKVLYSSLYLAWPIVSKTGLIKYYFAINGLLLLIQALNIMWFFMICKVAIRAIFKKEKVDDTREEDD